MFISEGNCEQISDGGYLSVEPAASPVLHYHQPEGPAMGLHPGDTFTGNSHLSFSLFADNVRLICLHPSPSSDKRVSSHTCPSSSPAFIIILNFFQHPSFLSEWFAVPSLADSPSCFC